MAALSELKKKKIQFRSELEVEIKRKEVEIESRVQAIKNISQTISNLEEENEIKKRRNIALQADFDEVIIN